MINIVIDGFNLIHKCPMLKKKLYQSKELAIASLLESMRQYSERFPSYKITLYIDGIKSEQLLNSNKIDLFFSGKDLLADDLIKKHIAEKHKIFELTVVSSDTEVFNFARVHACKVCTSEEFLRQLFPPEKSVNPPRNSSSIKSEKPNCSRKNFNEFLDIFENNPL